MKFRVLVEQDEDGVFVVECPTLPGCISQGSTRKESLDNINDAIKGYLESLKKHNDQSLQLFLKKLLKLLYKFSSNIIW